MHRFDDADRLLALTGLFFLLAIVTHALFDSPLSRLCLIVSEAALVGGIADWFAVTALFRKPLGISWHTNLILRNRRQVEFALINLIVVDLLNEQVLKQRFSGFPFTQRILSEPLSTTKKEALVRFIKYRTGKFLSPENMASISANIAQRLRSTMQEGDIPGWFILPDTILDAILNELNHERLQPIIRVSLETLLPKNYILRWLLTSSSYIVDLDKAATSLTDALLLKIEEVRQDVQHPLRAAIKLSIRNTADQVRQDPGFLQRLPLELLIAAVLSIAREELDLESFRPDAALEKWLFEAFDRCQASLLASPQTQEILDCGIGSLIAHALRRDHDKLGKLIQDMLIWMSDDEIISLIRKPIQDDLTRIRMNGSIIGAVLGLIYGILFELMI